MGMTLGQGRRFAWPALGFLQRWMVQIRDGTLS
jgi:hypothetical protein